MTTAPAETTTDTDVDQTFRELLGLQDQEPDDPEMMSHFVKKEDIIRSATTGEPVYAVCGKKWTPKKNPENYPVCRTCQEIYAQMQPDDQ